jgi:hypothetical protein
MHHSVLLSGILPFNSCDACDDEDEEVNVLLPLAAVRYSQAALPHVVPFCLMRMRYETPEHLPMCVPAFVGTS